MNYEQLISMLVDEIYKKINSKEPIKERMIVIGNKESENIKEFEESYSIKKYEENTEIVDALYVTELSIRALSNLSLGMASSKVEEYILRHIMAGKNIYILSDGLEYKKFKKTAPRTLYGKYVKAEEKLIGYGINMLSDTNEFIKGEDKNIKEINENEKSIALTKRLISESDLKKLYISGVREINIDKKSIITPLAKDYIRMNNINIKVS